MVSIAHASGEEVYEIIMGIEQVVEGYTRSHVVIALIVLATTLQKPDASMEEIQQAVKGVSEWLCLFLDSENDAIKH